MERMTADMWITIGIMIVAIVLFVTEWLSVDTIGLVLISLLVVTGILTPVEAIKGFSDSATVTIAAMFALSAALIKTGELAKIGQFFSKVLEKNPVKRMLIVMVSTGLISAFVNNTPVVAVLIPVILAASVKTQISASKLLIPLSFASMFGGMCTLIGTSPNMLVSSIAAENGIPPIGMFEMAPLGLVFFATGTVYLIFFGSKLIPDRGLINDLTEKYKEWPYLTEIRFTANAPSIGKTIGESTLVKKLEIDIIGFKRETEKFLEADLCQVIQEGDMLRVRCNIDQIAQIQQQENVLITRENWHNEDLKPENASLVEAVITPNSELNQKKLRQTRFKEKYNAIVLAIRGRKGVLYEQLSRTTLKSGDVLLLYINNKHLEELKNTSRLTETPFLIISEKEGTKLVNKMNLLFVIGVITLVVGLASFNILPIVASSILGVTLLVIFRSITIQEVYKAINWEIIFMLAGTISLGIAMERSGTAQLMAEKLILYFGQWGPVALVSALYLTTSILTELISNGATAILLTPIAISIAETMGVNPRPFLFAIAFAASSSFLTPIGYQTNTMIYSVGNYRFTDFFRVGLPLNLIFWILATLLIPVFYKF
jgi:di/tricarboxylate transporter